MTRLVFTLDLAEDGTAHHPLDLGLLAPSLPAAEIGRTVLDWFPDAQERLMAELRRKEHIARDRRTGERREAQRQHTSLLETLQ